MRVILHILTAPQDALASEIISRQNPEGADTIVVKDISKADVDYVELAWQIFEADSIQVW